MTYDAYGNIVRSGPKKASDSNVGLWLKRTMDETLHTHVTEVKDTYGNRVYNNSVLLQKQIIKYGKMTKDREGFGYIFTASGAVNKTIKMWRLGVNVAKRLVWHFGHGF